MLSILRGTTLGSLLGVLPGDGALLASFASYMLEKKVAKPLRNFGNGDIRGVAGPESANNAGADVLHPHDHAWRAVEPDWR
jgi:TctA family transporter